MERPTSWIAATITQTVSTLDLALAYRVSDVISEFTKTGPHGPIWRVHQNRPTWSDTERPSIWVAATITEIDLTLT